MAGEEDILDKAKARAGAPGALDKLAGGEGTIIAAGVPEGYDAFLLAAIARQAACRYRNSSKRCCTSPATISGSPPSAASLSSSRLVPDVLSFPAWDCVPYDRISPDTRHRKPAHRDACAARPRQGRQARDYRADDRERSAPARAAAGRDQEIRGAPCRRQPARDGADRPAGLRPRASIALEP